MALFLSCPQGHRWELTTAGELPDPLPRHCPVCGGDGQFIDAGTEEPGRSPTLRLLPPSGLWQNPAVTDEPSPSDARTIHSAPPDPSAATASRGDGAAAVVAGQPPTYANRPPPVRTPTGVPPQSWPQVPGYEILGVLGRGGMGIVYKARHFQLNRVVALKMTLAARAADEKGSRRFKAEAESVARFQHPNIVQVYEVGEHENRPFFSLEYVDGGSLAQKLNTGPLPPAEAAALIEALARAVEAAHRRGIVHRDLKPANVLLTPDGTPKVTDFGLAKRLDAETRHTQSGAILGTPSYMSPEQARGDNEAVGTVSDVYSLGAILYETLTGRPPFRCPLPMDTLLMVLSRDPLPPSGFQPTVPRDLETICLKCLEKDPARRYPSAQALADDVRRFRNGEPISARPGGPLERAYKWARRRPAGAAFLAFLAITVAALLAGSGWYNTRLSAALQATRRARQEAERQRDEARWNAYLPHLLLAQRAWEDGQKPRARELLSGAAPRRDGETDLRGFEWYFLDQQCRPDAHRLDDLTAPVHSLAYSPDGKRLAAGGADGRLVLWAVKDESERLTRGRFVLVVRRQAFEVAHTLPAHAQAVSAVAFSPDGRVLATAGEDRLIKLWDPAAGKETRTLSGHAGPVTGLAFSPNGRRLASSGGDGAVKLWEPDTGREVRSLAGGGGELTAVAFNPDGKRLAVGNQFGAVALWDVESGKQLLTCSGHKAYVSAVAFSPDGQRLAASSWDHTVRVWDAATGEPAVTFTGHTGRVTGVAFGPDGTRLASSGEDGVIKVWEAARGEELFQLTGHRERVGGLTFSPDGRALASAGWDRTVRVWDAVRGQGVYTLRQPGTRQAEVSPGGRYAATLGEDGVARVHDARTGRAVFRTGGDGDPVGRLAFSPDGRHLLCGGATGVVGSWDLATGKLAQSRTVGDGKVLQIVFSPDGRHLAATTEPGTVRAWELDPERPGFSTLEYTADVTPLVFSADGRRLAYASEGKNLSLWDLKEGRRLLERKQPNVRGVSLDAPNGDLLAVGEDGQVRLWSLDATRMASYALNVWLSGRPVPSPDRSLLAAPTNANTVLVWAAASGEEVCTLKGHRDRVLQVLFSPDARRLVTAGRDGTLRVWDAASGQEVLTLRHERVSDMAFSWDGNALVSRGEDGTVRVWNAAPPAEEVFSAGAPGYQAARSER